MSQTGRDKFYGEVAKKWLSGLVPTIIENGGDERDMLAITEYLVTGTLYILRESYGTDPEMAFERLKKQIDIRLADMQGEGGKEKLIING
jgi:hypothetical protein